MGEIAGKEPLYWQLAEQLRARIAAGEYAEGAQLPTEEALGQAFGVSRITVRGALDRLTAEGLLRRERGRGTFVAAPPVEQSLSGLTDFAEDMTAAGLQPSSIVVEMVEEPATEAIATALALPVGTPITRLERLRLADGQPLAFDSTYLPLRYGRLLTRATLTTETIYQQLASGYGITALSGRYTLEATGAPEPIAALLGIPTGAPTLLLGRTSLTPDGAIIYYQRRYYRGDRVRYRLELGRSPSGPTSRLLTFASQLTPRDVQEG
jgi:GntR family transcriptional regulator